jgi:hypothetical protein
MVDRHRFLNAWPLFVLALGVVVYVVVLEFLR